VGNQKIIPFRKRAPSQAELDAYRRVTHNWSPTLRQLLFPEYFTHERDPKRGSK
jgi:hypothetical protein